MSNEHGPWLVIKRDLYYRPNGQGYTGIRDHAGRYSYEEAKAQGGVEHGISIVRLRDAPEFTRACFPDLALKRQASRSPARNRSRELEHTQGRQ